MQIILFKINSFFFIIAAYSFYFDELSGVSFTGNTGDNNQYQYVNNIVLGMFSFNF